MRLAAAPAVVLVGLCVAFAVYAGVTHSEHVLVRRDAASNLQAAASLATTHQRVVPVDVSVIGGPAALERGDVSVGSSAFYQVGSPAEPAVQPQFLLAPAVVYGYGWWAGGAAVAQVLPAVAMALALLLLGLLVASVTGAWWGAAAAGFTALLFPVLNVARGTYSEQLALVTLVGGALALTLAVRADDGGDDRAGARAGERAAGVPRLALVAGILLGGTGFARIDSLREVLLLLPLLAVGTALAGRWVRPVVLGVAGSTVLALAAAWSLSYRYLGDIAASLLPLLAMAVAAAVASFGALWLWRRGRRLPAGVVRRLPDVAAGLVVLAGLGLASRPLWMTTRQDPNDPGARYVAGMQRRQGLPVDGGRTYAEHTVDWLSWYAGWVAVVVALLALALVLRHALRRLGEGSLEPWFPVLLVAAGSTVLTLLRPGITPDHPWADRRLLVALPFVVALVVVAAGGALARLEASGRPWGTGLVALLLVVGLGVPAVVATWPFRGVGVERGSLGAVEDVCAALEPGDVVLGVDSRATSEWPQAVRGHVRRADLHRDDPRPQGPGAAGGGRRRARAGRGREREPARPPRGRRPGGARRTRAGAPVGRRHPLPRGGARPRPAPEPDRPRRHPGLPRRGRHPLKGRRSAAGELRLARDAGRPTTCGGRRRRRVPGAASAACRACRRGGRRCRRPR